MKRRVNTTKKKSDRFSLLNIRFQHVLSAAVARDEPWIVAERRSFIFDTIVFRDSQKDRIRLILMVEERSQIIFKDMKNLRRIDGCLNFRLLLRLNLRDLFGPIANLVLH